MLNETVFKAVPASLPASIFNALLFAKPVLPSVKTILIDLTPSANAEVFFNDEETSLLVLNWIP